MRHLGVCLLFALSAAAEALAQAGGPELKTDDPYFPGEGAMSSPAKVLQRAFTMSRGPLGAANDREKFIRLFLWRSENYSHLLSPAIYNLPGKTPDPGLDDPLMTDYDAMRSLFSYGFGLCGTNHGQMRVFADEAGWASRRRGLQGDTGYEILVEGGWRYCNTDQYTIHFLSNSPTAHFASLDQVVNTNHHYIEWNPDLGLGYRLPQANTHGNYADFNGVTGVVPNRSLQWRSYYGDGTNGVWDPIPGGNNKLYGEGYTATPVAVRLKRGETFTRWMAPDGAVAELGLAGRIWWGYNSANTGPYSQYSFVQNAPARDEVPGGAQESAGNQRYGNGCFLWQPNLLQGEHLDGAAAVTGSLASGGSPQLKSTGTSTLVLVQNTPYTIAGRPADGTDPANPASDGAVISASAVGSVDVEISINAGATWTSLGALSGPTAKIDFTNNVKGRNQYLLRLTFGDGEGLDALSLRTVTMLNQAVYPNLKSGTASITYSSANIGALDLSPDLWSAASAGSATGYVQKTANSANLTGVHYSGNALGYESSNNSDLWVTYKVTVPPALAAAGAAWKQLFVAANTTIGVPPAAGSFTRLEISSNGTTWTKIGEYAPPSDNDFSSYWTYARSGDGAALGGTDYYIRVTTSKAGANKPGIRFLRFAGTYSMPASAVPIDVTYAWNNGTPQTNTHTVAAGASSDSWSIATGTVASQTKVVLKVSSAALPATPPSITGQPQNQTVTAGQVATFSVTATGSPTLTYQWTRNGNPIVGATGTSYSLTATLSDHGAVFRVTVSNGHGSDLSSAASLIVNPAPGGGGSTTVTFQQGDANGYAGTEDTYIDQFPPAATPPPYGNSQKLQVLYYNGGSGLTEHAHVLIRFDLSSIPATATVTGAKLTLFSTRTAARSLSDVVILDKVVSVWDENRTWAMGIPTTAPSGVTCPDVMGLSDSPVTPEPWVVVTGMDALVQGWVTTPTSNLGMKLSCTSNLNLVLASSEYSTLQYRPILEVTYTTGGGGGGGDTTAPTMSISSPSSGPASSSPLIVTGTASDAGGVSQVTWSNALTGQNGTASGTDNWTATIPLAPGTNDITITVTDSAGNPTTTTLSMTFAGTPSGSGGGGGGHKTCGLGIAGPAGSGWGVLALALLLLTLLRR